MTLRFLPLAVVVAALAPLHAQSPAAAPGYEVASVRRNVSGPSRSSFQFPDKGTVTGTNVSVYFMILQAYQVTRFTVVVPRDNPLVDRDPSAPAFDIQIKPRDNAPPGQSRVMLQQLLADRFKLRVHREQRVIPTYTLKVARQGRLGPELRVTSQDCAVYRVALSKKVQAAEPRDHRGTALCSGVQPSPTARLFRNAGPVADIARQIRNFLDRPLVDATGLSGNYEWTLTFALNAPDASNPSIFTALEEQLGLTLESGRAPYEMLVIDSVDWPAAD